MKVNQTFLNWTGYRRSELIGRLTFRALLAPGGQIFHETHLMPLLSMQGSVREIALELVGQDRRRLPVLINAVAKRDAAGNPLVNRITVFNATDRRQYERELMRARREAERSEARVRVLQQVTAELAAVTSVAGIADVVIRAGADAFQAVGTALWVLDVDGHALERVPPFDAAAETAAGITGRAMLSGAFPYAEALRSGEPVAIESRVLAAARYPALAAEMARVGQHALVAAPLETGDRHAGVVAFGFGAHPDVATELPLLRTLARQAGQALDRVRLHEETVERARRAGLLARLSRDLDELPGFAERAGRCVDLLAEELGGWACLDLAAFRPGRVSAVADRAPGWYRRLAARPEFRPDSPTLSRVAATGLAHLVLAGAGGDAATGGDAPTHTEAPAKADPPANADAPTGADTDAPPAVPPAWAVLPLFARGRALGTLAIVAAADLPMRRGDVPFLTDIADRVALGLENARLYEQERDNALTLQRSMLAGDLPRDARAQLVTRYLPAVATLEVGGDWYDAFRIDDDKIGIVVGDVVGRGIEAASAMGQLRSAVRAVAVGDVGPARLLQRLDMFVERLPQARMATVAYAEVALETGLVRFACAGHPPPAVVEPDGKARLLWTGRSAPLGARARVSQRPQAETVLPPGSRLLLYSDGLVERRTESIDAGLTRLVDELGHGRLLPLASMVDGLLDALLGGRVSSDDVCVLCLSVGVAPGFERTVPADPRILAALREDLRTWLRGRRITERDRDAVILACSEAVGNAVEHGYRDGPQGLVTIRAAISDQRVELDVRDRGTWRAPLADNPRGRGLMLMRRMMDRVTVERENGTRVTMWRRIDGEVLA